MWTLRRPEGRDAQRRDELIKVLGGDATLGLPGMWFFWANPYDIITAWRKVGIAGNKLDVVGPCVSTSGQSVF